MAFGSIKASLDAAAAAARAAAERAAKLAAEVAAKVAAKGAQVQAKVELAPRRSGAVDTFEAKPAVASASLTGLSPCVDVDALDQALTDAKSELDQAKAVVDENNKKLSQQLARLGPGLTEEQKKEYIAKFREAHAEEYQAYEAATAKLGEVLKQASALPDLRPSTTLRALDAAKALAGTPEGAEDAKSFAVAVAKKLEVNPNFFTGGLNNVSQADAERQLNDIVSTAVPNIYANELRLANGDPSAAGDAFAAKVEGLERLRVFSSSAEPIKKGIEALKRGDLGALQAIDGNNRFGKAFQIAGVALSIAKLASGADISATDYLQTLASTGKDGAELLALGMKALASSSAVSRAVGQGLETGAAFCTRIAPGLAVAANALQTSLDLAKLASKDGNLGDLVAVVGDAAATVGSVLTLTGVGAPVAVPLQVVGAVLGKAGNMMSDGINREQDVADQRRILEQMGLGELADPLSRVDPEAMKILGEAMSPEEVQELVRRNPDGFTSAYAAREYLAIRNRTAGYPAARG